MNMFIGNRLRSLREDKNFMKQDIAHFCNVTSAEVDAWETDEMLPEVKHLIKMATMYNVTIDSLVVSKESKKVFSISQFIIYGFSVSIFFMIILHLFSGISGELPLSSMFYREYDLQKFVFLIIIVSSITTLVVHVLHMINFLKSVRVYHQMSMGINAVIAITALAFMVTGYMRTEYFPNAIIVLILSVGLLIMHSRQKRTGFQRVFTWINYRKAVTYVTGTLFFGFAMFEFLVGDGIYDLLAIMIAVLVLLFMGIGTIFIPNRLFNNRLFITIYVTAPTSLYGLLILFAVLFINFDIFGILVALMLFLPVLIINLDYVKNKIDKRKDK